MLDFIVEIDETLFLYLNNLGTTSWDSFWLYLSRTLSGITLPLYFFILIASYRVFGWKKALVAIGVLIVVLLFTEFLSIFVKTAVGRLRPCYNEAIKFKMRLAKSYCGGQFSYFSAHACNSFALATFTSLLFKKRIIYCLFIIWALMVSYSRIYIGVHFPLDVLSGGVIGAFSAWVFYTFLFKRIVLKLHLDTA